MRRYLGIIFACVFTIILVVQVSEVNAKKAYAALAPITSPITGPLLMGFMTGGGSVFANDGTRVTHGFVLHCDKTVNPNNLEVNWATGKFKLQTLSSVACSDTPTIHPFPPVAGFDTYKGKGTGKYNGVAGATAEWIFTDEGEPGKKDTASIVIKDASNNIVLNVSGKLKNGNQQAHNN